MSWLRLWCIVMIAYFIGVCVCMLVLYILFFFFKQKTAYEMRISDWSSDVCSSGSDAVAQASKTYFGKPAAYMGEGGSIPFMGMLGEKFPQAQFLITGVLGPHSNAHGPNEFLHIPMGKRVTKIGRAHV